MNGKLQTLKAYLLDRYETDDMISIKELIGAIDDLDYDHDDLNEEISNVFMNLVTEHIAEKGLDKEK